MIKTGYEAPPKALCRVFPYALRLAKLSLQFSLQLHPEPGQRVSSAGTVTSYCKKKEPPWKSDFSIPLRRGLKQSGTSAVIPRAELLCLWSITLLPEDVAAALRFIHTEILCYIFFIRATPMLWIASGSQCSRGNPKRLIGSLVSCAESAAFWNLWGLLSISVLGVEAAEFCLG